MSVLILGASGNFGRRIANSLVRRIGPGNVSLFSRRADFKPSDPVLASCAVVTGESGAVIEEHRPKVIVNTVGPFGGSRGLDLAKQAQAAGIGYVDIADDAKYVIEFQKMFEGENRIVCGASTVPFISAAAVRDAAKVMEPEKVAIRISAGMNNTWGLGTVESVLQYAGAPVKQLEHGERVEMTGWRGLKLEQFPGILSRRFLAHVATPDPVTLPREFSQIDSVEVRAGVDNRLVMMSMAAMSYLRSLFKVPLEGKVASLLYEHVLSKEWLMRLISTDVGVMKVVVVGKDAEKNLLRSEFSLVGEGGDGPNVPCSPCVLLAERMFNTPSHEEVNTEVTLSDLQTYWDEMGYKITSRNELRAFRSPLVESVGTAQYSQMARTIARAHAFGGTFEGNLEVTGSRFWFVRLAMRLLNKPGRTSSPVPVFVKIVPTVDEQVEFIRTYHYPSGPLMLRSRWDLENGGVNETFDGWQTVGLEIRKEENGGFYLLGRETWPFPDLAWLNFVRVYSRVTPHEGDEASFDLHVEASAPLVGHLFGYKGKLRVTQ